MAHSRVWENRNRNRNRTRIYGIFSFVGHQFRFESNSFSKTTPC